MPELFRLIDQMREELAESSRKLKEISPKPISQSPPRSTRVSAMAKLAELRRINKTLDIGNEDVNQIQISQPAKPSPHMFEEMPERVETVDMEIKFGVGNASASILGGKVVFKGSGTSVTLEGEIDVEEDEVGRDFDIAGVDMIMKSGLGGNMVFKESGDVSASILGGNMVFKESGEASDGREAFRREEGLENWNMLKESDEDSVGKQKAEMNDIEDNVSEAIPLLIVKNSELINEPGNDVGKSNAFNFDPGGDITDVSKIKDAGTHLGLLYCGDQLLDTIDSGEMRNEIDVMLASKLCVNDEGVVKMVFEVSPVGGEACKKMVNYLAPEFRRKTDINVHWNAKLGLVHCENQWIDIVASGEKSGVESSDIEALQIVPPEPTLQSSNNTKRLAPSSIPSGRTGISEQSYKYNVVETVHAALTCEDLEEKTLSEYSDKSSSLSPPVYDNSAADVEQAQSKASGTNHAFLRLFSLLHKGTTLKDLTPSSNLEIAPADKSLTPEVHNTGNAINKPGEANGPLNNSGKNITLEARFGTTFMKELQSVEAPIYVHRSVAYVEPHGLAYHGGHDESHLAIIAENKSNELNFDNRFLKSNSEPLTNLVNVENWLGFADAQIYMESWKLRNKGRVKHGNHIVVHLHLTFGDVFRRGNYKEWSTEHTSSSTWKWGVVQFCCEPIKQISNTCLNDQKDELWPMLQKINVIMKSNEKDSMEGALMKTVLYSEVFTWGREFGGQLTHGVRKDVTQPQLVESLTACNVAVVANDEFHNGVITMAGPTCSLSSLHTVASDGTDAISVHKEYKNKNDGPSGKVYQQCRKIVSARRDVTISTLSVKNRKLTWWPTWLKCGTNPQAPTIVLESDLANMQRSVCMISNSTSETEVFSKINIKVDLMYVKSKGVHWYVVGGMGEVKVSADGEDQPGVMVFKCEGTRIKEHKLVGMFELSEGPVIAKRIALSWYWCVTLLVFDSGTLGGYKVFTNQNSSLRSRMILRGGICHIPVI